MSSAKFTPGPWSVGRRDMGDGKLGRYIDPKRGQPVARVLCDPRKAAVNDANADLLAASPEMYAALEESVWALSGESYDPDRFEKAIVTARAALAKARGEA